MHTATSPRSPSGTWRGWPKPCCRCSIPREPAVERANAAIERFAQLFETHWLAGMRGKLGLFTEENEDRSLADDLLAWMHRASADFTNTFRSLSAPDTVETTGGVNATFAGWRMRWQARRARQPQSEADSVALMRKSNPAVIPRNHKVEDALEAATARHDLLPMCGLLAVLAAPFDDGRDVTGYDTPGSNPMPYRTFCGT